MPDPIDDFTGARKRRVVGVNAPLPEDFDHTLRLFPFVSEFDFEGEAKLTLGRDTDSWDDLPAARLSFGLGQAGLAIRRRWRRLSRLRLLLAWAAMGQPHDPTKDGPNEDA